VSWTYLVAVDNTIDLMLLITALDREPAIDNWFMIMGTAVIVTSGLDAGGVARVVRKHTKNRRFIVVDLDTDRNGWLHRSAWDFIRNSGPTEE